MVFTQEEFDIMVDELVVQKPTKYHMLCQISLEFLGPKVDAWCRSNEVLRGRGYEEDILQEIVAHLLTVTVDKFFLSKDENGKEKYPRNPGTFGMWLKTVALHKLADFAKEVGEQDNLTTPISDEILPDSISMEGMDEEDTVALLREAFSIVLASNASIYKILTWLAQSMMILNYDLNRIKARDMVIELFEEMTLADMYTMILMAADQVQCLKITDQQHEKIFAALKKSWDQEHTYGETSYKTFFMKYRGEISPKKSISDWVNRMDEEILRKLSGNVF